jgi:hypothetical protein
MAKLLLLKPRDRYSPDVIPMKPLGSFGAVRGNRGAATGPYSYGEHRNPQASHPRDRVIEVPLPALAIGDHQDRAPAPLALMFEGLRRSGQGQGEIGRRVAQVVGARGVEKEPECGLIRSERKLEKGTSTKDDQPNSVAR